MPPNAIIADLPNPRFYTQNMNCLRSFVRERALGYDFVLPHPKDIEAESFLNGFFSTQQLSSEHDLRQPFLCHTLKVSDTARGG